MGLATTGHSDVTTYLTAVMALMRLIVHSTAIRVCFSVTMDCVFLIAMSVTMTMTVGTEAMSLTAHIPHVEGTTLLAPVVAVSTGSGFAMGRMIVKTTQMKKAVTTFHGSVTRGSGPVLPLVSASQWISCVMARLTVLMERMKLTPLLDATAASGDVHL